IGEVLAAIVITRMLMPYHRTATNPDIGRALLHDYERILHFCSCPRKARGPIWNRHDGVPIGHIAWHVDIGNDFYETSANGKASGVLSVFMGTLRIRA
ncbi:MAG TPA: hypothetical protein VFP79_07720, partial [Pseudolabrys sp.]|nr:hypothetical protein [Pseudolabrys sp.]